MAVFLINICKFNGCGITFPSLGDLIQHIEDTHIDYDPQVIEQKEQSRPACLPLSYVLRFITDAARKEGPFLGTAGAELKRKMAIKHHSYSMSSSNRSNTPTDMGSEMDEDEIMVSESEDSNDSWTTEEFSSEFIMRFGSRHSGPVGNGTTNEKPFACPVPGCKKRYKNVNGIKYHSKNGHKKDGKVRKGYKCHCGKSYKTAQGLKGHSLMAHNSTAAEAVLSGHSQLMAASPSPLQQSGSLSPSSASNTSGSSIGSGHANQSQLSPNSNSISSALNGNNGNINNHLHHQSSSSSSSGGVVKNNFGLVSMKTKGTNGAGSSSTTSSGTGHKQHGIDANGVKSSVSSLGNLGILTPATSPKHQQQQHHHQQPQNHQTPPNGNHHQNNHHHNNNNNGNHHAVPMHGQQFAAGGGGDHLLPLTPISPNMSKNLQFNNSNSNNNNVAADHITTDET